MNFRWSPFPRKIKHEKSSKNSGKIRTRCRGKIREENLKNPGNFRSATFQTSENEFICPFGVSPPFYSLFVQSKACLCDEASCGLVGFSLVLFSRDFGCFGCCATQSHHLSFSTATWPSIRSIRDRKGTPKNFCDKDFAELSGELSGAICLKTLVLMGNDRYPPRIVQKILWYCSCDSLALGFFFGSRL